MITNLIICAGILSIMKGLLMWNLKPSEKDWNSIPPPPPIPFIEEPNKSNNPDDELWSPTFTGISGIKPVLNFFSVRDCARPAVPRNAIISNLRDSYRSGQKVTFECIQGFNPAGMATQMCFQGRWTVLPFKCTGKCNIIFSCAEWSITST